MKLKIFSLSLLLSYLAVLSHEMVPHHHHDFDLDEFSSFYNHHEQHSHHYADGSHGHDTGTQEHKHAEDSGKERNNNFPFHQHISAANDFNCLRVELNRNFELNLHLLTVLNSFFNSTLTEPPELDFIRFTDKPFLLNTLFEPGATGLRAPPFIA